MVKILEHTKAVPTIRTETKNEGGWPKVRKRGTRAPDISQSFGAGVRKRVVEMRSNKAFNDSMAEVARRNPKVRAAMVTAAAAVMASIEAEAARHHRTGNYMRHLKIQPYGKAGGFMVVATDKDAWSIEFGHFVPQNVEGVVDEKAQDSTDVKRHERAADTKKYDSEQVEGNAIVPKETSSSDAKFKTRGAKIWVEGTHIMREGARKAAAHVGKKPPEGRLTLK